MGQVMRRLFLAEQLPLHLGGLLNTYGPPLQTDHTRSSSSSTTSISSSSSSSSSASDKFKSAVSSNKLKNVVALSGGAVGVTSTSSLFRTSSIECGSGYGSSDVGAGARCEGEFSEGDGNQNNGNQDKSASANSDSHHHLVVYASIITAINIYFFSSPTLHFLASDSGEGRDFEWSVAKTDVERIFKRMKPITSRLQIQRT